MPAPTAPLMPEPVRPTSRVDDRRMAELEHKIDQVNQRVQEIRDWLIGEPESSALGRQLLQRAITNAQNIEHLRERVDSIEDWRSEWRGVWRFVTSAAVILGIMGTLLGILNGLAK